MFDAQRATRMISARLHMQLTDELAAAAKGAPSFESEAAKWLTDPAYAGPEADSDLRTSGEWQAFLDLGWKLSRSESGFDPGSDGACWWAKAGQWPAVPPASAASVRKPPPDATAEERGALRPWIWAWSAAQDRLFASVSSHSFNELIPFDLPAEIRQEMFDGLVEAVLSAVIPVPVESRCAFFLALGFALLDLRAVETHQEQLANVARLFELVDERGYPLNKCAETQAQWPFFYAPAARALGREGRLMPQQCPFVEQWQEGVLDTVPKHTLPQAVEELRTNDTGVTAYALWHRYDRTMTNPDDPFGPEVSSLSRSIGRQPPKRPEQEEFVHFVTVRGTADAIGRAMALPFALAGAALGGVSRSSS